MTRQPAKQLPETMTIGDQSWTLMEPALYMRQHIGEITVPDTDIVFDISGSMNGLAVYLETPFPHPKDANFTAMYKLGAGETITQLAAAIVGCPDD